jgi:NADPH:quinone reductase-like Zn-dependent oxidoreductase
MPDPRPAADEAVVEVKACGMNHLDLWIRSGALPLEVEMPHILGCDIVGVVREVGAGVRHVKPGDKTLLLPTLSCGVCAACMAGDDNLCRHYDLIGRKRNGGYAQLVAVPAANCLPYPENLAWEQAAAVPVVFLTAWHMLVTRADLKPGEDCLVIGAGSGVGSVAVQLARMLGARVIATMGSEAKFAKARELGAHEVVNHRTADVAAEVRRLTDKKGVEVVFEHVGGRIFEQCVAALGAQRPAGDVRSHDRPPGDARFEPALRPPPLPARLVDGKAERAAARARVRALGPARARGRLGAAARSSAAGARATGNASQLRKGGPDPMSLEHHHEPLISSAAFRHRVLIFTGLTMVIITGSLGLGVLGYRIFAHLGWIDSLLNASMILTGMGPVDPMRTNGAKLFASFYAIFSGVAFLSSVGVFLAPIAHRLLHRFHLDAEEESRRRS